MAKRRGSGVPHMPNKRMSTVPMSKVPKNPKGQKTK